MFNYTKLDLREHTGAGRYLLANGLEIGRYGADIPEYAVFTAISRFQVSACVSDFDLVLRVYSGDMGEELAMRDDGGCTNGSSGSVAQIDDLLLGPGTYNVVVEGFRHYFGTRAST